MLGWEIYVHRALPNEDPLRPGKKSLLASWLTSIGGTGWLDDLARKGEITDLGGNGYPNRYRGPVKALRPQITRGPPPNRSPFVIGDDYVHPPGWNGSPDIDLARIASCAPDEEWLIEAWDQS